MQEILFETIGQMVEELDKDELLDILVHYNNYVADFYESHDYPSQPACLMEFVNNDYANMINELYE